MKFLARLTRGDIALGLTFWLIGLPLALVWDASGTCTVVGCGIQDPLIGVFLLALFALSTVAIPFVSVAIWRSSSKYPRVLWWQKLLAFGAKLCAALSGALAIIGFLVLLYMVFIFAYAAFDHV
jgi:hypothetical protein